MSEELLFEGEEQPHLLLVDDDPTFTRVLARAMSRRGLRVSTAGSAEEGLALAQQDTPDYAVLDLKMEGDSGLVLLPKLLELHADMRVVILTGYSSIATAVEAIKRGACNYLCKPRMPMTCWPRCSPSTPTWTPWCRKTRCRWIACNGSTSSACSPSTRATSPPPPAPWACIDGPCSASCRSGRYGAEA